MLPKLIIKMKKRLLNFQGGRMKVLTFLLPLLRIEKDSQQTPVIFGKLMPGDGCFDPRKIVQVHLDILGGPVIWVDHLLPQLP